MATLSVIVCTHNRCEKLARSLDAIGAATAPAGVDVEIVVVDNNSRDATPRVVEAFAGRSPAPVRYAFEAAQGLSYARNRGVREARGSVFANTDDDCVVDPDWLVEIWREFETHRDVGIVGGR
ncbi:MAG TPA: glycosyltransferase family A protein, partial [Burkholderiales bacterium]|nr:glycosyltransferase family A protein [Burkholderiales bacterium]